LEINDHRRNLKTLHTIGVFMSGCTSRSPFITK